MTKCLTKNKLFKVSDELPKLAYTSLEEFTKKKAIKDEDMRIDFNMPENIRAFDDDSSEDFQIPAKKNF